MKKQLLGAFVLCFLSFNMSAQLADGTLSPDFNLNDIFGVNHQLYADYLNNDKHVVLDFSATWCGPCWSYHNGGAIDGFYDDHGPSGDNRAMAFMMEADEDTNTNCLYGTTGCNDSTWGDWVAGTDYPIIDAPNAQLRSAFSIGYWPTIYMVNGFDNRIFEVGQISADEFGDWMNSFDLEVSTTVINPRDCQSYGSIEIVTQGGHGNLSYEWDDGSTGDTAYGLDAGDYYVTITDANDYFIERGPFTVTVDNTNNDLDINALDLINVSCNSYSNGYIEVEATGIDLSYAWSNGSTGTIATSLSPGTHSVIVTSDIGCVDTEVFTITEPPLLLANLQGVDPSCANSDGEIQIDVLGGTGPYDYELDGVYSSTGFYSNLSPGLHVAIVTDYNSCVYSDVLELMGDPVPVVMVAAADQLSCTISEVAISGDGSSSGSNFTYQWMDEDNNIIATTIETMVQDEGDYTLIVTDNAGCSESAAITVTGDFTQPMISSNNEILTCSSSEVEICMTVNGASSYYWEVNGQQISDLCVIVESSGDYTATAIAANGCESTSVSTVGVDTDLPVVEAADAEVLTCVMTSQLLSAEINGDVADHTIVWSTTNGNIVNTISDLEIEIDAPGVYEVSVTNNATGCNALTAIVVDEFINTPAASFTADNDDDFLYLTGLGVGNPSGWEWFVDGVSVGTTQDFSYPLMGEQTAVVCLQIQNECGVDETCNSVSITDPLMITVNSVNIDCFGDSTGSIEIVPQGGVSPYTVSTIGPNGYQSAAESLTNLPAGIYEITVNDSETRMTTATVVITENSELSLSSDQSDPLCNGSAEGSINLDMNGGAGDYTYQWSTGAETQNVGDLAAGTYSVEVTDAAGCMTESSFTLNEPDAITQDGVVQDVNCNGDATGSILLSLTGGTGMLSLDWIDSELDGVNNTNVSAGTYTLNIQDENGCASEQAYTVAEPDALVYNLENIEDDFNGNGGSIDVTVVGGVSPYDYNWSNGEMTEDLMNLMMGTYSLVVLDANGCELLTEDFDIEFISNVNEISDLTNFKVYPNPAQELFNVELELGARTAGVIQLFSHDGRLLSNQVFDREGSFTTKVNVTEYASGIYLLKINTENGIALKKVSILK